MKTDRAIFSSIILSFVAGYADTSTFVGADGLFSSHVTGNFVVLAYGITTNHISGSWIKLIAFPVFILAVFFSTLIVDRVHDDQKAANSLIILEGVLLVTAGLVSWFSRYENTSVLKDLIPMIVVFALGLQNASGRFFAKEVLAPTTVMTGNTTQFIIDLAGYLRNNDQEKQNLRLKIVHILYVILPFLAGCISGGLITKEIGLGSAVFIGLLTLTLARKQRSARGYCFDVRIPIALCGEI